MNAAATCPGLEHCDNPGCRRRGGCQGRMLLVDIVCRLGWTAGCPYMSCERAGCCMAPVPANDNEPPG